MMMENNATHPWEKFASLGAGALTALIGGGHLAAWLDGVMAQRGGSTITMKTNTALCLLLLGASLMLLAAARAGAARRWAGRACAGLALLVGTLSLVENLVGWNLGIDQLLAVEPQGAMGVISPNRTGTPASICIVLTGLALLSLSRRRSRPWMAQAMALVVCLIAMLGNIGHLYGVKALYDVARLTTIAWPTALSLLVLGLGLLSARAREGLMAQVTADNPGGAILRRLLIPAFLLPVFVGWLRLAGERMGLFDAALGTALVMILFITVLTLMAWLTGRWVSRSAAEIARQKAVLAVTLSSIGDGVISCDTERRVTFLNPVAEALSGWRMNEALGQPIQNVFKIINEQTRQPAADIVGRVLREGQIVELANHTALVAKSGGEVPIEDSAAPIRDSDGCIAGVVLVFHEVTEKRRAQEALNLSEEKFAKAFAGNPAAIALTRLEDGLFLEVNDTWLELNGYRREEVLGQYARQMHIWPTTEAATRFVQELHEKGSLRGWEQEFRKKNGEVYVAQLAAQILIVRGEKLILSTLVDITERKRAESVLQTTLQRFYVILSSMYCGILLVTDEGRVEFANRSFCDRFGLEDAPADLVGLEPRQIIEKIRNAYRHPDKAIARIKEIVDRGQPVMGEELALQSGQTCLRDFVPLNVNGTSYGRLWIHFDITERKHAEMELHKLNRTLRALSNSNQALMHAADETALLQEVCRIITQDCGYEMVWIGYAEEDAAKTVRPVASAGFEAGYLETIKISWADDECGSGPTGMAIRTGQPNSCRHMLTDPRFAPWREQAIRRGYASSLVLPLLDGGRAFGALTIYSREPDSFMPDEEKLLLEMAGDLAYGIGAIRMRQARAQAEEEVRRQREWLRVTLSSIGDGVITCDTDGRVTFLNPVAQALSGWTPESAFGQPIQNVFNIINEQTRQPAEDIVGRVLREKRIVELANHTALITRDGREVPIEDSAAPILEGAGNVAGAVLVFHDVAEKRHAQEALRISHERLDLALISSRMATFDWDIINNRRTWSAGVHSLLGTRPETFTGTAEEFFNVMHPEDRGAVQAALARALETGVYETAYRAVWPDGGIRHMAARGKVYRDDAGRAVSMTGVCWDVTEQKRAEAALREANEHLAEADKRKDEFLAMLAHELRNPLAPIRNAVQILKLAGANEPIREKNRAIIDRQASHMGRLLDDLLEVSRVTRGKIDLRLESLDLRTIVQQAVEAASHAAQARRLELHFANPPEPVMLAGDFTRLEQVVGNLINNAIKYSDQGEIQVSVGREPQRDGQGPWAVVRVRDTGIGIAPEMLPRVFELFAQADQSLERQRGGLGIGLTMVKRLVDLHHGRVEARSNGLGQGSEFSVFLPLVEKHLSEGAPAVPAPAPDGQEEIPLKVLVVDDNKDAAESLKDLLEMWGYQVRTAFDGPEGLQLAMTFVPDVVLLDIGLPGMSGYAVARKLREERALESVRIIAMTGYGQAEDRKMTSESGCDAHLVKPVDLHHLQTILARIMVGP